MKKIFSLVLAALLLCALSVSVIAAQSAFANVDLSNVEYINDTTAERGGKPIQFVETYGVGYGGLNDMVKFKGIDFGKNGADEMTISFSYGDPKEATLAVYVDKAEGNPAATYTIGNTGGWQIKNAKEFKTAIKVPAGVHDIFVKFTNDQSGSFSYIKFKEAAAPVTATSTATPAKTATTTASATKTTTKAPAASDMGLIAGIMALAASATGFVSLKKKR